MGGGYERKTRGWIVWRGGRNEECKGRVGIRCISGGRFWAARGGGGRGKEGRVPALGSVSKDSGRRLGWLTYYVAAAEGKSVEMAAVVDGNAAGELGVAEYLCVDL